MAPTSKSRRWVVTSSSPSSSGLSLLRCLRLATPPRRPPASVISATYSQAVDRKPSRKHFNLMPRSNSLRIRSVLNSIVACPSRGWRDGRPRLTLSTASRTDHHLVISPACCRLLPSGLACLAPSCTCRSVCWPVARSSAVTPTARSHSARPPPWLSIRVCTSPRPRTWPRPRCAP